MRRRGDPQPTTPCTVVVVIDGVTRPELLARAAAAARSAERPPLVAVVAVARILGSSLGLPHPGLLPTAAERQERVRAVEQSIAWLRRQGIAADGQVALTRRPGRTVRRIVRARGAAAVLIGQSGSGRGRLRRLLEGDTVAEVRRWCRGTPVEIVPAAATRPEPGHR